MAGRRAELRRLSTIVGVAQIFWLASLLPGTAQESNRHSLAGEAAAEDRAGAELDSTRWNWRAGPSRWAFGTELGFEVNDNIGFVPDDPALDVIVRPQVDARMVLPVSDRNRLNFTFSAGYSQYFTHPALNRFYIVPGSALLFDFYMSDLWINIHERCSLTQSAYQDPTLSQAGDYSQLQNIVGVNVTWDLSKVTARLGSDHSDYVPVTGRGGVSSGYSDMFSCSVGYRASSVVSLGLEGGGGWISYKDTPNADATDFNAGAFAEVKPTGNMSLSLSAGYTSYRPEVVSTAQQEFNGAYTRVALNHRLNRFVECSASAGRSVSFGFFAGTVEMWSARCEARWHLFQKLGVTTGCDFEHGSELLSGNASFERVGPGITFERSLTRKLSSLLRYQYYRRRSDTPGGDYDLNIVTLNFVYQL
ncbi:MAG TPA: hypothetical protein VKY92_08765 [Verrucomicrobiae bacterium]|nr:hypothetical protein [Verrucomicrobiae bacterium]